MLARLRREIGGLMGRPRRELAVLEFKLKSAGIVLGDDWHENPSHIHAGVPAAARELCATDRWEPQHPG